MSDEKSCVYIWKSKLARLPLDSGTRHKVSSSILPMDPLQHLHWTHADVQLVSAHYDLNPTTLNKITIKFNDKEGITNVTFN